MNNVNKLYDNLNSPKLSLVNNEGRWLIFNEGRWFEP